MGPDSLDEVKSFCGLFFYTGYYAEVLNNFSPQQLLIYQVKILLLPTLLGIYLKWE